MTPEDAEVLVQDLIDAVRCDERSWIGTRRMTAKEVKHTKEALIKALVTHASAEGTK